jgi:hypothetical protein
MTPFRQRFPRLTNRAERETRAGAGAPFALTAGARRATRCSALLVSLAFAGTAGASTIGLPSPVDPGRPPPPLGVGGATLATETRVPGRIRSGVVVVVAINAASGRPVRVVATQRLALTGKGDFAFTVPAPVSSVAAGPGTETEPGLRDVGIVWQGFSAGYKVLAAKAVLRLQAAAGALPLRVAIEASGGVTRVRFSDAAVRRVRVALGTASSRSILDALALARRGQPTPSAVTGIATGSERATIYLPLRLRGTISGSRGRPVEIATHLGGRWPSAQTYALKGTGTPSISIRVEAIDPFDTLPTPQELAGRRDPLTRLQIAFAQASLARQYGQFLANPDSKGTSSTVYHYVTAAQGPVVSERPPPRTHTGYLLEVLLALGVVAGLVGLVVGWAHL